MSGKKKVPTMSRELTKMNLIAIVQQLPEEDIHTIETYIRMIEQENKLLQEKFSIVSEMNVENYDKYCEALKEQVALKDTIKTQKLVIGDLVDRFNKAIEYIKKDTRWFDGEYASTYGQLCDCAGAKGGRLEVMVNPSNLLKILGDNNG